jgi:hypothetical protein
MALELLKIFWVWLQPWMAVQALFLNKLMTRPILTQPLNEYNIYRILARYRGRYLIIVFANNIEL